MARLKQIAGLLCVLCLLTSVTSAQRSWLGDPDVVPDRSSPAYGITYNDGNFSTPRPKPSLKSHNRLVANGYPAGEIAQWDVFTGPNNSGQYYAGNLVGWIDSQWAIVAQRAQQCGLYGVAPPRVIIRPTAWTLPQYPGLLIAGETDADQNQIQVVNLFPSSDGAIHNTADLLVWEFVNYWRCKRGGCPKSISDEGRFLCEPPGGNSFSKAWVPTPTDLAP